MIGMFQRQVIGIPCFMCGDIGDHEPGCPFSEIDRLESLQYHMDCPSCKEERSVDVNEGDYFECRKCHVQFCSGAAGGTRNAQPEEAILVDSAKGEFSAVRVLRDNPGTGIFRFDKRIAELKKQIEDARKKKLRGRKSGRSRSH